MNTVGKRIRYSFWFVSALVKRYYAMIGAGFLIGLVAVIMGIRFLPKISQAVTAERKIIGIVGTFTPDKLPLSVQKLLSTGLTDIDVSGRPVAALAEKWTISSDGKEYLFTIKPDMFWHDGKKFSAFDVNYNLKDVTFEATDESHLKVTLKDAFTPLPNFLSKPLFKQGLVGLGEYQVKEIKFKGQYLSTMVIESRIEKHETLTLKFFPTEEVAKTAFKLGEITVLDEIKDPRPFSDWKTVDIIENPNYYHYVGLFFNLNDSMMKEKEIRQAIAFALSKPEKLRVVTPLSSQSWAYSTRVKTYDRDLAKAQKMLKDKGIGTESALTVSTFEDQYELAQKIVAELNEAGLPTKLKLETGVPSDFQALLATQEISTDPDQYSFWHSTQSDTNVTHYASAKIDKLLEDGRKEQNEENRIKIYYDFQRYLVEDSPAVFLFHPVSYTVGRK